MDNWDPRRDDYKDANFNSYTRHQAGRNMPVNRGDKSNKRVQLFVTGVPDEITEDGLKNLFSRVGEVFSVVKKKSKNNPNAPDSFAFIQMENAIVAEKAMREFNHFKIGERFMLKVKVSHNEQEKRRNIYQLQDSYAFTMDDNDSGSDSDPLPSPLTSTVQNGYGGSGEPRSSMGVGRGQKLADLSEESKHKALLPTPKISPIQPPNRSLSISVQEPFKPRDISTMYGVGRGQYNPRQQQQQGAEYSGGRGGGRQRGNRRGGSRGGNKGYGRGHQYNNYQDNYGYQGRGRGHQYNSHYDGQGDYRQSYGRGQQYPQYPQQPQVMYGMPLFDPYAYGMMAAGAANQHLLQPAYPPMMATPMMNMSGLQQPLPTPSARKVKEALTFECSVCGKLGSLRCSRCKLPYCSPSCQKEDWPSHKDLCKTIQRENEANQEFSNQFDVSVGDELIPKVKELMEKAIGEKIDITRKSSKEVGQSGYSSDVGENKQKESEQRRQQNGHRDQEPQRSRLNSNTSIGREQTDRRTNVGSRTQQEPAAKNDKGCLNCGSLEHRRKDCTEREGINSQCFCCKQIGHLSRECPMKQEKNCFACGGMGHLSKDCPNKLGKRNEYLPRSNKASPPANIDDSILTNGRTGTSEGQITKSKAKTSTASPQPKKSTASPPPKKSTASPPPKKSLSTEGLSLHNEINVVVTDVQNPSCIWLQKSSEETVQALQSIIPIMEQKFSSSQCDVTTVMPGEYYGCQFSEDKVWYRARILNMTGSTVTVQYVDFGNTEQTKMDKLRQLDDTLMSVPAQAIKVSLEGLEPVVGSEWNSAAAEWLTHIPPNLEYKLTAHKKHSGVYEVTLKNGGGWNVAQNLIAAGLAKQACSTQPGSYSKAAAATDSVVSRTVGPLMAKDVPHIRNFLTVGETVMVLITEMLSPAMFHLQVLKDMETFSTFVTQLNQLYSHSTELKYSPLVVGELVASRYTGDEDWYRGEVTEINSQTSKIYFLDYGNSEIVTIDMLRKAQSMCAEVPLQAVKCSLMGSSGQKSIPVMNFCKTLENQPLNAKIIEIREECVCVELYEMTTGESILDKLNTFIGPMGDAIEPDPKPGVPESATPKPVVPESAAPVPKLNAVTESAAPKLAIPAPNVIESVIPSAVEGQHAMSEPALSTTAPDSSIQAGTPGSLCIAEAQLAQTGEQVQVVITNIIKTAHFYLQLGDAASRDSLSRMWVELNEFYASAQPHVAVVGEFVAAQFTEGEMTLWYRARVVSKSGSDTYTVFFIDYGNTDTVDSRAIAKLDSKFASLPSQALCCKLARCPDSQDSQGLAEFFKYQEVLSLAKVIEFSDNVYTVELYQPDNGANINDSIMAVLNVASGENGPAQIPVSDGGATAAISEAARTVPEATIALRELPVDGTLTPGLVVYIEDLSRFFVHIMDGALQENLGALYSLSQVCENDSEVYTPVQHEYISAKFTADSAWYRAKVIRTLDSGYEVVFVDFGNMDIVPGENIRKQCKELDKVPVLAIKCALAGSGHTDCADRLDDFKSILNTSVNIKVLGKTSDTYIVELFLMDEAATSVNEVLHLDVSTYSPQVDNTERGEKDTQAGERVRCEATAVDSDASQPVVTTAPCLPVVQVEQLSVGQCISAAPILIHSVNHFYVQGADDASQGRLVQIFMSLTDLYKDSKEGYIPAVGEFVAVFYNDGTDELWYRSLVTNKLTDGQCAVHLIDYGNDIQIHTDLIRKLDKKLYSYPPLAYKCRLHGFDIDTETTRKELTRLSFNKEMSVTVRGIEGDVYSVDLVTLAGQDLATHLLSTLGTASARPGTDSVAPHQDSLPCHTSTSPGTGVEKKVVLVETLQQSKPETDNLTVVITSVVTPNLFHCQVFQDDQKNLLELKLLSDSMKLECEGSYNSSEQHKWQVGELCCAKFPEDGEWYRGAIMEVFPDHRVNVVYVDFGNTSEVSTSQLRPIALKYTELPLLAFKCSLNDVSPVGASWSQEAAVKMSLYQDRPIRARVVAVNKDVYELELETIEGEIVVDQLVQAGLAKKPSTAVAAEQAPRSGGEVEMLQEQNKLLQQQLSEMQAMMAKVLKQSP